MASLFRSSRRLGIALALALGLTILSAIVKPLLGDELTDLLPGPTEAQAGPQDGCC
jgi:hypothetical protein